MACSKFAFCVVMLWLTGAAVAQSEPRGGVNTPRYANLPPELHLVPQTLLGLIHASEVQQEIGVENATSQNFLEPLREIDGPWWRARNLPGSERRDVIAKQEQRLIEFLGRTLSPSQLIRLRQLELQAQGPRMLLRPEVIDFLKLSAAQQTKTQTLFTESERLVSEASLPVNRGDEAKLNAARQAKSEELAAALKILTPEQQRELPKLLGENFETAKLDRIYPLAPELIESKAWVGNRQVKLEDLRGKVVLLHFYAFQCHNCKANFKHYIRWQQTLAERGVVVVGIQTPELADERDPLKVSAAAEEQGFEFPVLIDLENANWEAWGNTMWPTVYVIDREGYIRLWWQGELNWQGAKGDKAIEELVEKLLK